MGIAYLVPDFNATTVGTVSGNLTKEDCKRAWFTKYAHNFRNLPPSSATSNAEKSVFWKQGYAAGSKQIDRDDSPGGVIESFKEFKPLPKSFGKDWKDRKANGKILLSNWRAYRVWITRKGVPQWSIDLKLGSDAKGYWFFLADGTPISGPADAKGRPYFSMYIAYRYKYVESHVYLDELDLSDDDIVSILRPDQLEYDNGVITSALAEANQGYWDVLTELAELPATLTWAMDLINQAKAATEASVKKEVVLRKKFERKLMTAAQLASALSSVWLQYRYAISPIAYSLSDIQDVLINYRDIFRTSRGWSDQTEKWLESIDVRKTWYNTQVESSIDESKFRVFIKRSYDPANTVHDLLRNYSANPFSTAYELVPLSFVADWFVNFGDVIAAATGPTISSTEASSASWKFAGSFTLSQEQKPGPTVDAYIEYYERRLITPSAHIELEFAPYLNWKRTMDALALSWTFSKKDWEKIIRKLK